MILKASQRAGAAALAKHLLRTDENEHVELHELKGFVADDLPGALREAYAMSRATRCKQFLFSLSLSPPETERVPAAVFEDAIARVEAKLGLTGQPRAIVFHEKEGRRHAHCVWSRIDGVALRAVPLPHFKLKLVDLTRELFLEHGWRMPRGLMDSPRDPFAFSRAEWQQARRAGHDPKALKRLFAECWAASDSRAALQSALAERGFLLARGDRRGFVAVDVRGEVYALARYAGVRTAAVRERLGEPDALPSIDEARARIAARLTPRLRAFIAESEIAHAAAGVATKSKLEDLTQRHREERRDLNEAQAARCQEENAARARRLPRGLRGLWSWLTGKAARIRRENEREADACANRDTAEKESLIARQLSERQVLQVEIKHARRLHSREIVRLHREVATAIGWSGAAPGSQPQQRSRAVDRDFEPER
jgi:hypothetical protein